MGVGGAWGEGAVGLGEAEGEDGVGSGEVEGLARRAFFFDAGLELAGEVELGDLLGDGMEELVVFGWVGGRRLGGAAEGGGAARAAGAVDAEGREADGSVAEGVEEVGAEVGVEAGFGDEERVVGTGVGGDDVAEEGAVFGVEVGGEDVDRRGGGFPDGDVRLLRAAGGVFLAGRGAVAVFEGVDGVGDPDVAVHGERNSALPAAATSPM